MPSVMHTQSKSQWDRQPCGCIKAALRLRGRVVIRCNAHQGLPAKKGKREVLHFDADGIVRDASHVPSRREFPVSDQVYFARLGDLVKIGISHDPVERANSLNAELLTAIDGGRDLEARLHREFADLRVRGEWFSAEPSLLERIEELRA